MMWEREGEGERGRGDVGVGQRGSGEDVGVGQRGSREDVGVGQRVSGEDVGVGQRVRGKMWGWGREGGEGGRNTTDGRGRMLGEDPPTRANSSFPNGGWTSKKKVPCK